MSDAINIIQNLKSGSYDEYLAKIYFQEDLPAQKERHENVLKVFNELYSDASDVHMFSAPGRTEVGGNHTDHNHGKVLAASINLDTISAAAKCDDNIICEKSLGHGMNKIDITDLDINKKDFGKSVALIKGMCKGFLNYGYKIGGFNCAGASQVLSGSGLSSSAAFEVLIGTILNYLYNDGKASGVEIAKIAQYAENEYFGKPCGLMDQMACSVGGFISIDFKDNKNPIIEKVDFDFASCSHYLCIVDTKADHADLTDEYSAVRTEMESVARCFGKNVLREVDENDFYNNVSLVRKKAGDRAVLRAYHFYSENKRVDSEKAALKKNDFEKFKKLVIESGYSSFLYNQNVFAPGDSKNQPVSVALSLLERILKDNGAWRVHGGGFAGTVQAFVPENMLEVFKNEVNSVFGNDSCHVLSIRPYGGIMVY